MIKIGDKIKDNDPRMGGNRVLTIVDTDVSSRRVQAVYCGRKVWIKECRIYTDGKPRRSGFDLVNELEV